MKPLTIEHLKSLDIGDWVWVITEHYSRYVWIFNTEGECLHYQYSDIENRVLTLSYYDYGTKWMAYKNKEQAEKYVLQRANEPNGLYSIYERVEQLDLVYTCVSKQEAERRLAELKGE